MPQTFLGVLVEVTSKKTVPKLSIDLELGILDFD